MKNGLLFLLLIFFSCTESSPKFSKKDIDYIERDKETGWFRVHNKKNKWGFIDKDSSIVIPFEYDFVNPFENGLAYAKIGRKEFFITKRNLRLEGDFDEVKIFSFGLAGVRKNKKWGFIDEKGKLIIQPIYDEVQYFTTNGLCSVVKNGKSGFIDKTGKEIIPVIYDDARSEQLDDIVIVQKDKKWAFFDNKGKQLSGFLYDEVFSTNHYDFSKDIFDRSQSTYFKNGAVLVRKGKNYEFLNEKIEPAFPNNKFDSATVFDGFKNAIVKRNGKYGMIKSDGQIKVPFEYDFIEAYDSNHGNYSEYFNARKGKVYSIFNQNLKKIGESLEPIYNNFRTDNPAISFKNLKGKYGVVDRNGTVKVPFVYDEELQFERQNYAVAKINNEVGLIDSKNKILIPFGKQFIYEVFDRLDDKPKESENYFIVANDNTAKIVDINNKTIVNGYQSIHPLFYDHSKFLVKKNKKFGVIDLNNKILSPIIYDEFSDWVEYGPENRHIVKLGSKSGMLEYKTFKEKIPAIYDFVFVARDKVFVGKNKKFGIIDLNNKIICPLIYDELKPNLGYGLGFGDDKIYARKGMQYFEINSNGKILKSFTKTEFLENTKEPEPPPPPPKIK
ncbi:WG repeat-containing protein [Chryseobacterium sp. FH1]|uniref:WG repeat-containing protein n=1 Tax=Chryseobacterium sp. FH1 TaxID=1233951 RepID=UPI0004E30BE1|nr:WG repeat-containing protein [Chryseobacterium sp. FH1]KFC24099.1 hypothetical protein IO90_01995 [Chryseobacterium sp. FH1]